MAKKSPQARKRGGAAAIETIEDDLDQETADSHHESNGDDSEPVASAIKPKRAAKAKADQPADGSVGIADIKKAAAFANSIGGLDKAIALLQILKVAKEVR
jgi:hypothetical protein